MLGLGLIVLTNAALATLLGLIVLVATTRWRAPRLVHLLWVLVLARLLVPPIMELGVLPPIGSLADETAATSAPTVVSPVSLLGAATRPLSSSGTGVEPVASVGGPDTSATGRWRSAVPPWLVVWLLGGLAVAGIYAARSIRFRRIVRSSLAADPGLVRRAGRLADRLGLSRPVSLRVTERALSPLVWPSRKGPVLLLPRRLVGRLSEAELDTLITHELAHIRRRDHLVRRVELLAAIVYWWHPIVWWARRALRDAEEACCDQLVLDALPGSAHAYAEGILQTLELARGGHRLPALASGMSRFTRMQARLTMIMSQSSTSRPSRPLRWLPITAAISALVVFPTFAERTPQSQEELETLQREEAMAIERQAIDLDERQLELRRAAFEVETLQAEGRHEEAEQLRAQAIARQMALDRDLERKAESQRALARAEQRELEQMRQLNDSLLELDRSVESDNVRLEIVSRIRDLRSMVEYLGDDGEMTALLDRLEAAALARLEEGQS